MQYIKYVTESIFRFLADGSELVKECVFGDCMRLSNDEVITIGIHLEGIFEEILRAAVKHGLHAEESHCKGILCGLLRVRD